MSAGDAIPPALDEQRDVEDDDVIGAPLGREPPGDLHSRPRGARSP